MHIMTREITVLVGSILYLFRMQVLFSKYLQIIMNDEYIYVCTSQVVEPNVRSAEKNKLATNAKGDTDRRRSPAVTVRNLTG